MVGERVCLGRNAVLHPHVVIYEGSEIGDDFVAHSHASVLELMTSTQDALLGMRQLQFKLFFESDVGAGIASSPSRCSSGWP